MVDVIVETSWWMDGKKYRSFTADEIRMKWIEQFLRSICCWLVRYPAEMLTSHRWWIYCWIDGYFVQRNQGPQSAGVIFSSSTSLTQIRDANQRHGPRKDRRRLWTNCVWMAFWFELDFLSFSKNGVLQFFFSRALFVHRQLFQQSTCTVSWGFVLGTKLHGTTKCEARNSGNNEADKPRDLGHMLHFAV